MWSACTYRKYLFCEGREVCLAQSWSMHRVVVWGFGSVVAVGHQNGRQEMGIGKPPSRRLNPLNTQSTEGNGKAKVSFDIF